MSSGYFGYLACQTESSDPFTIPHPTAIPRSFIQSDFLPPINVLLFLSAAVTESPSLFPVVSACCLVTAKGASARGRESHFLSSNSPKAGVGAQC